MERQAQLIELSPEHAIQLQSLVHPYMELEKKGYILSQLSKQDLDKKKRCGQCNKTLTAKTLKHLNAAPLAATMPARSDEKPTEELKQGAMLMTSNSTQREDGKGSESRQKQASKKHDGCSFHAGKVGYNRQWSCCGGHPGARPCCQVKDHAPVAYSQGELEANWRFELAPSRQPGSASPPVAVAVDCEMGTAASGECELIRVSMIDYFTGTVLLDSLVWPDVKMAHFNTRYSGVSRQAMNQALRNRTCLFGRNGARKAIWDHVGPETIVIGHSLNSDLTSLRWIHHRVVDTLMIEDPFARTEKEKIERLHTEAILAAQDNEQPMPSPPKSQHPGCSLKALTKAYLKRDIQLGGRGHDSLEDATATRDLLHWHIVNRLPKREAPDSEVLGW